MLAAVYWLFVVNGPTPVVKARIEDEIDQNSTQFEDTFDLNQLFYRLLKLFVPVIQQET